MIQVQFSLVLFFQPGYEPHSAREGQSVRVTSDSVACLSRDMSRRLEEAEKIVAVAEQAGWKFRLDGDRLVCFNTEIHTKEKADTLLWRLQNKGVDTSGIVLEKVQVRPPGKTYSEMVGEYDRVIKERGRKGARSDLKKKAEVPEAANGAEDESSATKRVRSPIPDKVAKQVGFTGVGDMNRTRRVLKFGHPELVRAMDRGRVSIFNAFGASFQTLEVQKAALDLFLSGSLSGRDKSMKAAIRKVLRGLTDSKAKSA